MEDDLLLTGLEVRYGSTVAVTGVDLRVPAGTTLAVIGPNGSGKSTLLKAVAGIHRPSAGTVALPAGRAPALVLQSTDVDRSVPIGVRETVAMARYPSLGLFRRYGPDDRDAVTDALRRLQVDDLSRRQLHDLSGGQRQRVLVAQGLAQDAPVLLLDEPFTGVDVVSRSTILSVVTEERHRGRIVVMTTHSLEDARHCDQILLLDQRMVAAGAPDAVLRAETLRQAFGGRVLAIGDELVLDDPHHVH